MYEQLKEYALALRSAQAKAKANGNHLRIDTPEGICKTLWIPQYSGNRTATIDLNHFIVGFNNMGHLYGQNGNCGTYYRIIPIPQSWTQDNIQELAELVCKKLGKAKDYPTIRVLKDDDRMSFIISAIEELASA